jgi:putative NADH-flavin reductase
MRLAIIGAAGRLGWCVAEEARALDHRPAQLAGQQAPERIGGVGPWAPPR